MSGGRELLRGATILGACDRNRGQFACRPEAISRARGQEGMGILEILIAGAVLALAVVGLALMFSEGQSYAVADGDDRVAIALAQEKIEHVRSLGFRCIPVPAGPGTADAAVAWVAGCPDDTNLDHQAARKFNETSVSGLPPRYASRQTQTFCADPVTLAVDPTGCGTATFIRVQVTPIMGKARAVRVDTVMTVH